MARLPGMEYDTRLQRLLDDRIDADLLVLGSSRASRDVVPHVIEERTGIKGFNLGYPGCSIEFQEFLLDHALALSHPPRIVLLVVDDPALLIPTTADFRLDRCFPLAGYDDVNKQICAHTGKSLALTQAFASYRIKESIHHLWDPPQVGIYDTLDADGAMLTGLRSAEMDLAVFGPHPRKYPTKHESPMLRDTLLRMLQRCKARGVRVVIIHPPDFREPRAPFIERVAELAAGKADIYHYNSTEPAYRDPDRYFDMVHLDREGAHVFSKELAVYLAGR
ncbi:MAG: hypothetical protein IPK99_02880 [Flavobacteriales bacterium]|nr:hypothetical protein [Flavobacteriales bacterium]